MELSIGMRSEEIQQNCIPAPLKNHHC